jgi:predicted RNase H-like HicB family nuclease
MPHKYELIVSWSHDDDAYVVDVPDLPGCMAHGSTPTEAVAEAELAIDLWLEAARELGRQIPEPTRRSAGAHRH